ncbi:uncharacterized protein DUF4305 [Scopulibacillus darangshiensis]|uniref:Uncharacterized protein DUF4305 n=1 Tax=Scopulibacillus darangshiensis TaxID=442528 RepID=A0A4R2NEJ0_9BACL|nr:DUF4305 domain-containing protein [Scopulibacillus darangshiensis]TCP19729.1 uncharacterized protein DUF4305 [Scopulibacillus darangshiensis]
MNRQRKIIWGFIYLMIGSLFIFAAAYEAQDTVWNAATIFFAAFAAFDVRMGFHHLIKGAMQK